jgi:selenocysteine lyase/cysteine desulfurase
MNPFENHFYKFRKNIVGINANFSFPFGKKKIIYADWTASGRLYAPIERALCEDFGPFVANTHTETNITGSTMTAAYHKAKSIIKEHVGASKDDIIISSNSGMTGVVNKFQRILGLRIHEKFRNKIEIADEDVPLIFVTHMEHHSNQTSWLETIADVEVIPPDSHGLVSLAGLEILLKKYKHRKTKIAAITSCSNVTGIFTPYHQIAEIMHQNNGWCFVDFACSAPYIPINMHPENPLQSLDAIYFSPHKFLGGPGSTGILIFNSRLYTNKIPDHPGGGTVDWTNPWGEHKYIDEIELREDGGTPAFLPTIKVALSIRLKESMNPEIMAEREKLMVERVFDSLKNIPGLQILADQHQNRLPIFSFYIKDLHYNLGVKLLNDRFGIQVRGGCSCAGTYGHYLLEVSQSTSASITQKINFGDLSDKPGWIRMSLHPVMSDEEVDKVLNGIKELALNFKSWSKDYVLIPKSNEFRHISEVESPSNNLIEHWFKQEVYSI